MNIKTAKCVGLEDSMSKIKLVFEHDGVVYEGIVWSENDGRDAEIDHPTFNPPLPDELVEDFWEVIFEEQNIHLYEAALAVGYEQWESGIAKP